MSRVLVAYATMAGSTEEVARAVGEELAEAAVGLGGGAEAGVLAHGPEATAVHGGLDAAGEGVLAGEADVAEVVGVFEVGGGVDAARLGGGGAEGGLALREAAEDALEDAALPFGLG